MAGTKRRKPNEISEVLMVEEPQVDLVLPSPKGYLRRCSNVATWSSRNEGTGDRCNLNGHPIRKATGHNYWKEHSVRVAWMNFITSVASRILKLEKEDNLIGYGTNTQRWKSV